MAQNNAQKNTGRTETGPNNRRIGHWIRVAVMFLSGGFVFPHAMTEDDEPAKVNAVKDPTSKAA